MSSSVLVGASVDPATVKTVDRTWKRAATVFAALGVAIGAVATIDLAMAWLPFRFGNGEWEFGTVTRTLDSLPLATTGVALLAVAAAVTKSRWALRLLGVVFLLSVVALIICLVLYGLNVPVAIRAVPVEAAPVLKRAIARTLSFGLIYIVFYAWLSYFTWRAYRAESRG